MATFESNLPADEDYLEVDAEIPGQKYVCMSFISPQNVHGRKDVLFIEKFMKEFAKEQNKGVESDSVTINVNEIAKNYEDYIAVHEQSLEDEYHAKIGCKTSVQGLKIRGVYAHYEEAQNRSKLLQERDRDHNVYLGQVGYWLPWDPNPGDVKDEVYLEKELNDLMRGYKSNMVQKDLFYNEQVNNYKKEAAVANEKKKRELEEQLQTAEYAEEVKEPETTV
jgi:hypothetical protein